MIAAPLEKGYNVRSNPVSEHQASKAMMCAHRYG